MNTFSPNSPSLFFLVAIIILFVIAQSFFFTIKAWRRGKELGIDVKTMQKTVMSSILFTMAPAISILIGVISLSKFLGFALPWLRLSVIGSITYEFAAATTAATALGININETIADPMGFATIAWVMTLGIIPSLILVPVFGKRIQSGVLKIKAKDSKWGSIFMDALFLGMISAFLGMVFATVNQGLIGWIPVFVMISSSLIMIICGIFIKKLKIKWLEDFALPLSMLGAMACAIPITTLVESLV